MDKKNEKKAPAKRGLVIGIIALAALLVLVIAATLIIWNVNDFSVQINLNGEQETTLEHGQIYTELGAEAAFAGTLLIKEPVPVAVQISGSVDTAVLGTYEVTYSAEYVLDSIFGQQTFTQKQTRTVHVVDTVAPEITLVADPEMYTLPGQVYAEEGYTAVDDYDGDITAKVIREVVGETVVYTVSDSSGNQTQVVRQVVYDDPIPPQLVLEGKPVMVVYLNKTYEEPGYKATDNVDGDITDLVTVEGTVDTTKEGTYELIYTVKDNYDNVVTATRKVEVTKPAPSGGGQIVTGAKAVYLTFDDGPGAYTSQILDILDKYGVKATFFVVKQAYPELLTRMARSGHTVAIHSLTHNYNKIYASEDAFFEDMYAEQKHIAAYTGITTTLLRFPGGSSNTVSRINPGIMTRLTKKLTEMGYTYFDWNVDSKDAGGAKTPDEVYRNVVNGISTNRTSVVLMHDIHWTTLNAVERIIKWGLANDCSFYALTASSPTMHHGVNN